MAKVIFKTFQEAAAFSKEISMTIKATTSIKRDGDCWYVDDPRAEQGTSSDNSPANNATPTPDIHSSQYDSEGYDAEGYDINEKDRDGSSKYPF